MKKYDKYFDNDKTVLRYLARLNSQSPYDRDRKFLISFFLSDDSIQIFELQSKNSGLNEGKFLERRQYKNEANSNSYFRVEDFEINNSVKINSYSFFIYDADEYTKKWMLKNITVK